MTTVVRGHQTCDKNQGTIETAEEFTIPWLLCPLHWWELTPNACWRATPYVSRQLVLVLEFWQKRACERQNCALLAPVLANLVRKRNIQFRWWSSQHSPAAVLLGVLAVDTLSLAERTFSSISITLLNCFLVVASFCVLSKDSCPRTVLLCLVRDGCLRVSNTEELERRQEQIRYCCSELWPQYL